ncbi:MAG: FHA domain-containing protein [Bacteriovoracia bacterium]
MAGSPAVLKFPRGLPPTKQFGERLRLLVVQGNDSGTCFSVLGDLVFIGREDCQILINDDNLSRKHAEIGWQGDHYLIRDLGSSNGIVHNGQKVSEAKLAPGDLVMIGLTVLEVYPAGQNRKREKPMLLPGTAGKLRAVPTPDVVVTKPGIDPKKKAVQSKRTLILAAVGLLIVIAYLTDDNKTIRQNAHLPIDEPETNVPKKKLKKDELAQALAEYVPNYALDTQQRRDSQVFFRNGVRELQNKNYRRAFTAFDTALTVDPSHELAKIYLKTAKKELLAELKNTTTAGIIARKSLRNKEARMHFANVIRYLEGETGDTRAMENEQNKEMRELYDKAKDALKELDKEESGAR